MVTWPWERVREAEVRERDEREEPEDREADRRDLALRPLREPRELLLFALEPPARAAVREERFAPDLALPDLALPDLALPDLALPDLALPDFVLRIEGVLVRDMVRPLVVLRVFLRVLPRDVLAAVERAEALRLAGELARLPAVARVLLRDVVDLFRELAFRELATDRERAEDFFEVLGIV